MARKHALVTENEGTAGSTRTSAVYEALRNDTIAGASPLTPLTSSATVPLPSNGRLTGIASFSVSVNGSSPVQVNVSSESTSENSTSDNSTITDLIADVNSALAVSGLQKNVVSVRL